tara:strand:- start:156 stop:416 length:261 start_codon:yes stop_codon:yes gene_type:complete
MEHLEQDIKHIKECVDAQGEILSRLSNALTGDKKFGTKGISQMCVENSAYIEKDKLVKAKITGIASIVSVIGAAITTVLMKIFFKQ